MRVVSNVPKQHALPWVEKYRPTTLADLSEQSHVTDTVVKLVNKGLMPHLLFYGPPGTGKTTTILAVARHFYGLQAGQMTLELNASDERGIDVVRSEIQAFASSQRFFTVGYKLVILDECDNMTKDAQFALRRIIEKYTRHTRFCLIANYASKIIPALQSRCMKFRFAPFSDRSTTKALSAVLQAENVSITESALSLVVESACGDMRRACNFLQSCALSSSGNITDEVVFAVSGLLRQSELDTTLLSCLNGSLRVAVNALASASTNRDANLATIISSLSRAIFAVHLPSTIRSQVLKVLADTEMSLTCGCSEKMQARSLAAAFASIRYHKRWTSIE